MHLQKLLMKIFRITLYKSVSALRICRNTAKQMFTQANLQNAYNSVNRYRRGIFIGVIALVILLYLWPSWMSLGGTRITVDHVNLCIDAKLSAFTLKVGKNNALTQRSPLEEDEKDFLPFVGNGYLGASLYAKDQMYIYSRRALSVPINFYPAVSVNIEGYESREAHVISVLDGTVSKVQCFKVHDQHCVTVTILMYAHRARPGVLVQEFRIHNPSDTAVTVDLEQIGLSGWEGATSVTKRAEEIRSSVIDYSLSTGVVMVPSSQSNKLRVVALASVSLPESVTVQSTTTWSHHIVTTVQYSAPVLATISESSLKETKSVLSQAAESQLNAVLLLNSKLLRQEHEDVWSKLWHSGFSISQSRAPGAVNGDVINLTLYYMLSHSPSPLHELARPEREKQALWSILYHSDRCYEGHHTLQNERLWKVPSTLQSLVELINVWTITLEKQGCHAMLGAGGEGVLQAMILSLGPLQFKNDHLEFRIHPKDLHRDYFFRRINYGNNTHVNISVIVGDNNKAVLKVALDRNDRHFYACDAGCLDAPVKLSSDVSEFPVKLTEPLTAILYITADKIHMEELKHAIHVKEIAVAPAHEHHVMAMHRHGHHLGGLPVLFWGSLGVLIVIFHLFLFKMVYNEYCVGNQERYSRNRYSL